MAVTQYNPLPTVTLLLVLKTFPDSSYHSYVAPTPPLAVKVTLELQGISKTVESKPKSSTTSKTGELKLPASSHTNELKPESEPSAIAKRIWYVSPH